ncbi:MAG: hypothetical protein ACXU8N_06930 [Telluria sp.]
MSDQATEQLVRRARRSLWFVLLVLLLLGAYAIALNFFPGSDAAHAADRVAPLLPIVIVIGIAALSARKGAADAQALRVLLADELRQYALQRAQRNGLFAVLVAQPLLVALFGTISPASPLVMMAVATTVIALATVLASVLFYDR